MAATAPFAFLCGMLAGSFASVLAYRVPRGESWVTGRSHCTSCGETIAAYDNIPVVSWLALRGRCRHCSARIPVRYPLIELGMAVLFAATVLVLGTDDLGELALGLVFCAVLVTVTVTDFEQQIIPNKVLLAAAVLAVGIAAVTDPSSLPERFVAAVGAGGFMLAAALAYPRGMGMGDVKLVAVMGLFLGRDVVPALAVAMVVGTVAGLVLLARDGRRGIPFGPFLALGGVVGLLAGDEIINWYLDTFAGGQA